MINLIVAYSLNRIIGDKGNIPWRLSNDMKWFKEKTLNQVVIMGRKTFDSLGKPLDGRVNFVLTKQLQYHSLRYTTCSSLDKAIEMAMEQYPDKDIYIIGGGEIYKQSLPLANRIYVTEVHTEVEGDAFFPNPHDYGKWYVELLSVHYPDERNQYMHTIYEYVRVD